MGTNRGSDGRGREPGSGLMEIPKLDAQRKEEIRSGIMSGIRSWTKVEEEPEPRKSSRVARRRWLAGGGIGAGCAAIAVAFALMQPQGLTEWGSGFGVAGGDTGTSAQQPMDSALTDGATPQGVAGTVLGLRYAEFAERWAAYDDADAAGTAALIAPSGEASVYEASIPGLDEFGQAFGAADAGNGYTAWANADDGELRELTIRLGAPAVSGSAEAADDAAVIRHAMLALQPGLTEEERAALLDRLRFRDFEARVGYRTAESGGVLYTLERGESSERLIVQLLRVEGPADELGQWQDSLLDILREERGE